MVSDKEILMQAAEKYAKGIASNFFGLSTLPAQTAVTYVIRNWVEKHDAIIDLFIDKNNNINTKILSDAFKAELKERGGFKLGRVKFGEADVDELFGMFEDLKVKNK
jgi:hypothetical protein|nr:MAG TPA: hypothetical protein [Caudoviricetes sp.]